LYTFLVSELFKDTIEERNLKNYKKNLIRHGVPENNESFSYGNAIPLEYNLVMLNGGKFL
jgi:hypothetical protein